MVYQNKLVACVKVDGKILREEKDFVSLPFGSEYSILVKNLNSVRAQVRVSIDGDDATGWIIIGSHDKVEFERFVKGNLDQGNRFKFIERTKAIEDHRGIEAEDGLIRIEYAFEKKQPVVTETVHHHYDQYHWSPYYWPKRRWSDGCWGTTTWQGQTRSLGTITNTNTTNSFRATYPSTSGAIGQAQMAIGQAQMGAINCSATMDMSDSLVKCAAGPVNDIGITVPGSISNQKFVTASGFETEQSDVLVLRLRGFINEKKVEVAVTVDKKVCPSCGKKEKNTSQFCPSCGTSLNVV